MIKPLWIDTVSYHLNSGTNHKELVSFIYLGNTITNDKKSNFFSHIVNLYNNTKICTNSDAMGHNCPTCVCQGSFTASSLSKPSR